VTIAIVLSESSTSQAALDYLSVMQSVTTARRSIWLISAGAIAYVLEYGLGVTGTHTRYVVLFVGLLISVTYVLRLVPKRLSGRLKHGNPHDLSIDHDESDRDLVFDLVALAYLCIYLVAVYQLRPRPVSRFLEALFSLSPVEVFWLFAPLVAFHWFRQRPSNEE